MLNRSRWAEQMNAGDSISKTAEATLASRLGAVAHFLPLAANHADQTPEHVHQLRVYTRRSLAALSMYEEQLDRRQAKWFRKWLRRIRKAAGEARDLDVFLGRYEKRKGRDYKRFLRQVRKRRRRVQRPIGTLNIQLIASGQFAKHTDRLLDSFARGDGQETDSLEPRVRSKVAAVYARFVEAVPKQPDDLEALHRFRLRGKELRYTMELSASLFPPEFRTSLYPLVTRLQNKLGKINDHATARRRLINWSAEAKNRRQADLLCGLIVREHKQLEKSIKRFKKWWRPKFAQELDNSFRAVMNADRAEHA
jgi:CHAD domain-containing protein